MNVSVAGVWSGAPDSVQREDPEVVGEAAVIDAGPGTLAPLYAWGDPGLLCRRDDHDWSEGFGPEDVPNLIALAQQWSGLPEQGEREPESPEFWVPFHALRILAWMGTCEAIAPLLPVKVLCLDLDALIRAKRAAGRPKDFEAIAELEAIREELDRERAL